MIDDSATTDATFLYELARDARATDVVAYLRRGSSPVVRRRAAEILGELAADVDEDADEAVVRGLVDAVRADDDEGVRARAIDALAQYGEDALDRLVRELDAPDGDGADRPRTELFEAWLEADRPEFRLAAATALGRIGRTRSLSALLPATTDPSPRVRARAVTACGRIGDERCLGPIQDRLDDPQPTVRKAAVTALGSIGTQDALRPLVSLVRDGDERIRRAAAEELGEFGALDPVVPLVQALTDDVDAVQRAALLSLVQLLAEAPPERRRPVQDAVAEPISRADTLTLVPDATDLVAEGRGTEVRHTAAWLLGHLADVDGADEDGHLDAAYDCLLDALGAADDRTARLAAASLAELGGDDLERRLRILIEDEDVSESVTARARSVLEAIGGSLSTEVVTNAVEYTYVLDPSDYTDLRRDDDSPADSGR
jgi:HEAT repeat protein